MWQDLCKWQLPRAAISQRKSMEQVAPAQNLSSSGTHSGGMKCMQPLIAIHLQVVPACISANAHKAHQLLAWAQVQPGGQENTIPACGSVSHFLLSSAVCFSHMGISNACMLRLGSQPSPACPVACLPSTQAQPNLFGADQRWRQKMMRMITLLEVTVKPQ